MSENAPTTEAQTRSGGYQLFMLALCIFALLALAVDRFVQLSPDSQRLIQYADFVVCMVFLLDFGYSLATAKNKTRYFITWGWIDLLSSIPRCRGPPDRTSRGNHAGVSRSARCKGDTGPFLGGT